MSLFGNGKVADNSQYDKWSITDEGKIVLQHVGKYNDEKVWEEKETIFELSKDCQTLTSCDDESNVKSFVKKFDLTKFEDVDFAGLIVTMHEYIA